MKYFVILLFLIGLVSSVWAESNFLIEIVDEGPFLISEPYSIKSNSSDIITFHGVNFTHPSRPNPPTPGGVVFTKVSFEDGRKESLSKVGPSSGTFLTKHMNPQAGFRANSDQTISLLVSVEPDRFSPLKQMRMGIPLYMIKCKEGLYPTFKIDRVTPACVTEKALNELVIRGWAPLRMGMPAETNILITYDATMVYPPKVTHELYPGVPAFNMIFWVNNDVVPHTILSEDGTWSTGIIESGKLGSMSFNQTGIYKYFIKEKPDKTGIIDFSGLVDLDDN